MFTTEETFNASRYCDPIRDTTPVITELYVTNTRLHPGSYKCFTSHARTKNISETHVKQHISV